MNGFDTPESLLNRAHQFDTFSAVFKYMRADRCSKPEVDGLHSVGIKIGAVYEAGNPTEVGYFSAEQGKADAEKAVAFASAMGIPAMKPIFFAVDYDASQNDVLGPVGDYIKAAYAYVRSSGLLLGVYGSGLTCGLLKAGGFAHYTWLAQSPGWTNHDDWKPKADVVQSLAVVSGLNSDEDTVVNEAVVW